MTVALETRITRPFWIMPLGDELWGDVWFDRLWPEWRRHLGEEVRPNVDFYEKDGKYHLTAEVPGLTKDDISVSIDKGFVVVSGKKETTKEETEVDYYVKETRTGSFTRTFRLPGEVDEDKVEARYKDGVLSVIIPRKEESKTRKIEIH